MILVEGDEVEGRARHDGRKRQQRLPGRYLLMGNRPGVSLSYGGRLSRDAARGGKAEVAAP